MIVNGNPTRTIWLGDNGETVEIIDQTRLPHEYIVVAMDTLEDAERAIFDMLVRGAPLIGATAAYGMALAMRGDASDAGLKNAYDVLYATRPTAVPRAAPRPASTASKRRSPTSCSGPRATSGRSSTRRRGRCCCCCAWRCPPSRGSPACTCTPSASTPGWRRC